MPGPPTEVNGAGFKGVDLIGTHALFLFAKTEDGHDLATALEGALARPLGPVCP
jgi:hypothetical protein